jgi:hypothetical protein
MPISYALLLCIPIGFLFFWIARLCLTYAVGRYEGPVRRGSIAFGVFGALLIPNLWTVGNLQEEFSNTIGTFIPFLVFAVEGLVLVAIFRPFPRRDKDKSGPRDRVES